MDRSNLTSTDLISTRLYALRSDLDCLAETLSNAPLPTLETGFKQFVLSSNFSLFFMSFPQKLWTAPAERERRRRFGSFANKGSG
jgi:hypothetical protein